MATPTPPRGPQPRARRDGPAINTLAGAPKTSAPRTRVWTVGPARRAWARAPRRLRMDHAVAASM
ncbi:MAG: hypothetical protein ACRD1T_19680, partial [Acidimicrobiia bacterium]